MEYKDLIIPTINVNDTKVTISDIQKENLEYIEEDEVHDALGLLILRDGSYSTVKIDWSDKEAVEEFLDS